MNSYLTETEEDIKKIGKEIFQAIEYVSGVPGKFEDKIKSLKKNRGLIDVMHIEGNPDGATKIILYSTNKNFNEFKYGSNMSSGGEHERDCNKIISAINSTGFVVRKVRFKNKEERSVLHHMYLFPFTIEVY